MMMLTKRIRVFSRKVSAINRVLFNNQSIEII